VPQELRVGYGREREGGTRVSTGPSTNNVRRMGNVVVKKSEPVTDRNPGRSVRVWREEKCGRKGTLRGIHDCDHED